MNEWVYYSGGPKHGQILLGKHAYDGYLMFDSFRQSRAYYRLTGEMQQTSRGPIPIAEFVGNKPTPRT